MSAAYTTFPQFPHLGERLGKGWQLSTIYTAISGRPFSVLLGGGADPSGQGMSGSSFARRGTELQSNTTLETQQYIVELIRGTDPLPDGHGDDMPNVSFLYPVPGTVGNSRRNQFDRARPQPMGHDADEEHQDHRNAES